jgi:hypothetical protein
MSSDYTTRTYPLARRVLTVAVIYADGSWCAYVDAVRGQDHLRESGRVLAQGVKLREHVARGIFSDLLGPYSH